MGLSSPLATLGFFVLAEAMIGNADALTCYACQNSMLSGATGLCADPFSPKGVDTQTGCVACGKSKSEVKTSNVTGFGYYRTCEAARPAFIDCRNPLTGSATATQCYCITDYCNGAEISTSMSATVLLGSALAALYVVL